MTADPRVDQRRAAARDWLWAHTSQPNGEPWDADPPHLEQAATLLAAHMADAAGAQAWRQHPVRGGANR